MKMVSDCCGATISRAGRCTTCGHTCSAVPDHKDDEEQNDRDGEEEYFDEEDNGKGKYIVPPMTEQQYFDQNDDGHGGIISDADPGL